MSISDYQIQNVLGKVNLPYLSKRIGTDVIYIGFYTGRVVDTSLSIWQIARISDDGINACEEWLEDNNPEHIFDDMVSLFPESVVVV